MISIMTTVLTYAGLLLLILLGIYLTVAYACAVPLMLDKGLSHCESLEASRKAVNHRWFSVFGTAIVVYLLGILLTITLMGMIWGVPMMLLAYGYLCRMIFGYGTNESVDQPVPGDVEGA